MKRIAYLLHLPVCFCMANAEQDKVIQALMAHFKL
ncbi:MAG: hypothetical protein RLZZ399_1878 [Verrucomicrobiota bacterium]|jgi:hypothetical protein